MSHDFIFFDIESSGTDTSYDQPYTVAIAKTDKDLNIKEEIELKIRPRPDVVPHPGAFKTHCLDIDDLQKNGISEYEASRKISAIFRGDGNQIIVGYNSTYFDDEMIRKTLFRNLEENPYGHEFMNGNKRMDIMHHGIIPALAYSPSIFNWPMKEPGVPSLKLENLSKENGIIHENAHDAMSDVYATIGLAKQIKEKNPAMWEYNLSIIDKNVVKSKISNHKVIFQTDVFNTHSCSYTKPVMPIGSDSISKNTSYAIDLTSEPQLIKELANKTPEDINRIMYTPRDNLGPDEYPLPIKKIQHNKAAYVKPIPGDDKDIKEKGYSVNGIHKFGKRFKYSPEDVISNIKMFESDPELKIKIKDNIQKAMSIDNMPAALDPVDAIYKGYPGPDDKGFPTNKDKSILSNFHLANMDNFGYPTGITKDISSFYKQISNPQKYAPLFVRLKYNNAIQQEAINNKSSHREKEIESYFKHINNMYFNEDPEGRRVTISEAREEIKNIEFDEVLNEEQVNALSKYEKYLNYMEKELHPLLESVVTEIKNDKDKDYYLN